MARSTGSIHVADNSVTAINDALQQLLFLIDELRGEHSSTRILIGPHTHSGGSTGSSTTAQDGGPIAASTINHDDLLNVTTDQHHAKLHETSHRNGGLDEIEVEYLGTLVTDTSKILKPDGSGGLAWGTNTSAEATDVANIEGSTQEQIWEQVLAGTGISITELANGNAISISASGGSAKPFLLFKPTGNEPPSSLYAYLNLRNNHPVLVFDGATDWEAVWTGVLQSSYAGGGLTVNTYWSFTSATSGSLRVQAAFERIDVSSLDIDADSFASFNSAGGTAPGTSGQVIKVAITFANGSEIDSLAAGEMFRLKIRRDADGTSGTDDITTNAELLAVTVEET